MLEVEIERGIIRGDADAGKNARRTISGSKEVHMVRRNKYQRGSLFQRGKKVRKVWVARWREPVIDANGSPRSVQRSEVLGTVAELTKKEAQNLLASKVRPYNEGRERPQSHISFGQFVTQE